MHIKLCFMFYSIIPFKTFDSTFDLTFDLTLETYNVVVLFIQKLFNNKGNST